MILKKIEKGAIERILDGADVYKLVPVDENTTLKEIRDAIGFAEFVEDTEITEELPPVEELEEIEEVPDDTEEENTFEVSDKPSDGVCKGTITKRKIDEGKIVALHNAKWSNQQIAEEIGTTKTTVAYYLCQARKKGMNVID